MLPDNFTEEDITEELIDAGYETPDAIEAKLKEMTAATAGTTNFAGQGFKDLVLRDASGNEVEANSENLPADGKLTVTVKVSELFGEGFDATKSENYNFHISHMFESSQFGRTPGETEEPDVTLGQDADGDYTLTFTLTGLSPALGSASCKQHSYVDGVCSTCGAEEPSGEVESIIIKAIEVSYDAEALLRQKFVIPDSFLNDGDMKAVMTKDGRWGTVTKTYSVADLKEMGVDNNGFYVLEMGVASGEMLRDVTVQFIDGEGNAIHITNTKGSLSTYSTAYSVLDYVEMVLKGGTDEQKKIAIALVTYGGYAQSYFDVDEETPAYSILAQYNIEVPSIDDVTAETIENVITKSSESYGVTAVGLEPFLDSALYMRVNLKLDEGASFDDYTYTLTYTVNHNEYTKEVAVEHDDSRGTSYVTIPDIPAAYMDYDYTVTITKNSIDEVYEVSVSMLAWIKLVLQRSDDAEQIAMAKAMYLYNQAANEFFGK